MTKTSISVNANVSNLCAGILNDKLAFSQATVHVDLMDLTIFQKAMTFDSNFSY